MRIHQIDIQNFRGIEQLSFNLNPQFNLLIGENGSGKTAVLEALTVAMGSFFLGIKGSDSRAIRNEDIRIFYTPEGSVEFTSNTIILAKGDVNGTKDMVWKRERQGIHGGNLTRGTAVIKKKSDEVYAAVKDPKRTTPINLPILAYYSTARLWKESRENTSKLEETLPRNLPSRLRGYKDALQTKSTFAIMLKWFQGKFSSLLVKGESSFQLNAVRTAIIQNIPGCTDVYWEFDPDKLNTLYIALESGEHLPFRYLSDGYRNLLAIFADLAYRCVTLNPHFGETAPELSSGIVLIDELDLHLHPAWQKDIVRRLKSTFPNMQFVATTHSPFIIQNTEDGEIIKLNETGVSKPAGAIKLGIEDIAEEIQDVDLPQMSLKKIEMYETAEEYYKLLNEADNIPQSSSQLNHLKAKLDDLQALYSDDPAYFAFLKQERIAKGL